MCGRFLLQGTCEIIAEACGVAEEEVAALPSVARYNISPSEDVLFIAHVEGRNRLMRGRWWLVPNWLKEMPRHAMFNARGEDAHDKPSFRDAFRTRRCLIPADGYYEWTRGASDRKQPYCMMFPDWQTFAFAGLWDFNPHLNVLSCTILTLPASPEIAHIHHRMPVILKSSAYQAWLDPATSVAEAQVLMGDNLGSDLQNYPVHPDVGRRNRDDAMLLQPIDLDETGGFLDLF